MDAITNKVIKINLIILLNPVSICLVLFLLLSTNFEQQTDVSGVFVQLIGYAIASIFAILSRKRRGFLIISLIGWMIIFFGFVLEKRIVSAINEVDCEIVRRENNCRRDSTGKIFSCTYKGTQITGMSECFGE